LLVHGRWFSPGTPASSITKTGRHDIAEVLLKVALNTKIQINQILYSLHNFVSIGGNVASSAVDHGFKLRAGQAKECCVGICCFSAKHVT
jgi:hypothetical protein